MAGKTRYNKIIDLDHDKPGFSTSTTELQATGRQNYKNINMISSVTEADV